MVTWPLWTRALRGSPAFPTLAGWAAPSTPPRPPALRGRRSRDRPRPSRDGAAPALGSWIPNGADAVGHAGRAGSSWRCWASPGPFSLPWQPAAILGGALATRPSRGTHTALPTRGGCAFAGIPTWRSRVPGGSPRTRRGQEVPRPQRLGRGLHAPTSAAVRGPARDRPRRAGQV